MQKLPLLHVGFHKTGTTFLQESVFAHPQTKGFASPWGADVVQHFIITHRERFDPAAVRAAFDQRIAEMDPEGTCVPVLSHEALSRHNIQCDAADRVIETFPQGRVLFGIREQKAAIRSLFGDYVRRFGELRIDQYLGSEDDPPGFAPYCPVETFEYHLLIRRYVRHYGPENVLVMPMELLRHDPLAYENRIHEFAGTGRTAQEAARPKRVGRRGAALALRRRFNKLWFLRRRRPYHGDYASTGLGYRCAERVCRIVDRWAPDALHRHCDRRLKEYIEQRIGDYYHAGNQELSTYVDDPLAELGYDV